MVSLERSFQQPENEQLSPLTHSAQMQRRKMGFGKKNPLVFNVFIFPVLLFRLICIEIQCGTEQELDWNYIRSPLSTKQCVGC